MLLGLISNAEASEVWAEEALLTATAPLANNALAGSERLASQGYQGVFARALRDLVADVRTQQLLRLQKGQDRDSTIGWASRTLAAPYQFLAIPGAEPKPLWGLLTVTLTLQASVREKVDIFELSSVTQLHLSGRGLILNPLPDVLLKSLRYVLNELLKKEKESLESIATPISFEKKSGKVQMLEPTRAAARLSLKLMRE